jgi:hypothetical protein
MRAGTNTSISALGRSQQAKLGILGTGVFGGARAFIDRFNALSAWVTFSVLNHADIDARAQKISFFIRLAGHLSELANFNGLMIVLTALQQGCIARLKYTFEVVPKQDKAKLALLQVSVFARTGVLGVSGLLFGTQFLISCCFLPL